MLPQGLGELPADAIRGIQADHRLLRDQRDLPTTDAAKLRFGERRQVPPLEQDPACLDLSVAGQEAEDRHRGDGLAAA